MLLLLKLVCVYLVSCDDLVRVLYLLLLLLLVQLKCLGLRVLLRLLVRLLSDDLRVWHKLLCLRLRVLLRLLV